MDEKVSKKRIIKSRLKYGSGGIIALCALKMEARALREALLDVSTQTNSKVKLIVSEEKLPEEKICEVFRCGIGPIESTRRSEEIIEQYNPRLIVNFGLAGCMWLYNRDCKKMDIGDLAVGEVVIEPDEYHIGEIYRPRSHYVKIAKEYGFQPVHIGTVDGLSNNDAERMNISYDFQVDLVDMEACHIHRVAAEYKVNCVCLKVVSDFDDEHTDYDFMIHAPRVIVPAARQAAKFISRLTEIQSV